MKFAIIRILIFALPLFFLSMGAQAQPANDNFAQSTNVFGQSGELLLDNTGATKQASEPNHASNAGGATIWVTLNGIGGRVFVDTEGSEIDTLLATYTGNSVNTLNLLNENDDRDPGSIPAQGNRTVASRASTSRTFFDVVGIPYRIAIDGKNGAQGKIRLRWRSQNLGPLTQGVAAVSPSARAVQIGNLVSAFATMINAGAVTANNCALGFTLGLPLDAFFFQTTDPLTNAPVGTANTPVNIAPGAAQSFVFSFTPSAALNGEPVEIAYRCDNMGVVAAIEGVNTFQLTATVNPTPDLVSISATPDGDGIVKIPVGGAAAFSVAAINIGSNGTITFRSIASDATLPLLIFVCETDNAGACMQPPAASVNALFGTNESRTFSIFLNNTDNTPIVLDPAKTRAVAEFLVNGQVVGATSVAVQTVP